MVYEQRADALKAKSQFNDVALDGQPMKIEMVESQGNERMLSSGIRCAVSAACAACFICLEPSAPDDALVGRALHTSLLIVPLLGKPRMAARYQVASSTAFDCSR